MFKRWAWRLLRWTVEAKVIVWIGRVRERARLTAAEAEQLRADIMDELDRAFL